MKTPLVQKATRSKNVTNSKGAARQHPNNAQVTQKPARKILVAKNNKTIKVNTLPFWKKCN